MFFKILTPSKEDSSEATKEEDSSTQSRARLGMLKNKIPTPAYTFTTNSGALPGIISTNCPDISHLPMQLVLADIYHLQEIIEEYKKFLSESEEFKESEEVKPLMKYLNHSQDTISFLTMGIAGEEKVNGHPKDMRMEFIQKDSTTRFQNEDYIKAVKTFQPDLFMTPTHSITGKTSKKKRERAVKASREYITPDLVSNLPINEKSHMLMTISIEESYKMISPIIYEKIEEFSSSISGYFFNVDSLKAQTRYMIFNQFYEKYPEDTKLRVLESTGNPVNVLENLLLNGIDLFEARYPIDISERNLCLDIQTQMPEEWRNEETKEEFTSESLLSCVKKPKTLDLSDKAFRKDSTVLTEGSDCPATNSINRSYIYHLLDCNEMNATILLTLHNLEIYNKFFEAIRLNIESKNLPKYAEWFITTQCE
ncbi:unnamed protein product [Moneuplotes crassus]|uniref:tRNA-guanine(15) transglycosylase-like domain-containing protein n=1 Tax=Euplotes crassus TaxID=5936 RepID=A0AAD1XBT7_EUPCR|nr:unnamed protein product [Moneuplotes crassus]